RILVLGQWDGQADPLIEQLSAQHSVVVPGSLEEGLRQLRDEQFSGVFLLGDKVASAATLLEAGGILEQVPDGIVLLDLELKILWSNNRFRELTGHAGSLVGGS